MPYTLTKGLLWFLLALALGVIVGWLLRSIRATRQVRASRHARHDAAEAERLRARIANLEPLIAENARLRAQLGGETAAATVADHLPDDLPDDAIDTGTEAAIDARVPADEPDPATPASDPGPDPDPVPTPDASPAAEPDVPSGEPVEPMAAFAPAPEPGGDAPAELDDLTAIEGVGPAIAELLNRIGVHTWAELSRTEVSLLRTMLSDAGPQFATHRPDTWPEQAALLAAGRWDDFQALVARHDGGTPVE